MTQTWNDLLFAHWPVDEVRLRSLIPRTFEIDLFDSTAWIGVVPFRMTNVGARGLPLLLRVSAFPELNVRTYGRVGDRPGVVPLQSRRRQRGRGQNREGVAEPAGPCGVDDS